MTQFSRILKPGMYGTILSAQLLYSHPFHHISNLQVSCTLLGLRSFSAIGLLRTSSPSAFSFWFLPLQICDRTVLLRSHRPCPTQCRSCITNGRLNFTANLFSLLTTSMKYGKRAKMLFIFLPVSVHIHEKAASTAHADGVLRDLRYFCFDIGLLEARVKTAEDCCLIFSKLIEKLQFEHQPWLPLRLSYYSSATTLSAMHFAVLKRFFCFFFQWWCTLYTYSCSSTCSLIQTIREGFSLQITILIHPWPTAKTIQNPVSNIQPWATLESLFLYSFILQMEKYS